MARPWNTSLTDDWYEDEEENVVATIAAQERGARAHDAAMLNGWDPDELIRRAHRRLNATRTPSATRAARSTCRRKASDARAMLQLLARRREARRVGLADLDVQRVLRGPVRPRSRDEVRDADVPEV